MAESCCGAWQGILSTRYYIHTRANQKDDSHLQNQSRSWQSNLWLPSGKGLNPLEQETSQVWEEGSRVSTEGIRGPVGPISACLSSSWAHTPMTRWGMQPHQSHVGKGPLAKSLIFMMKEIDVNTAMPLVSSLPCATQNNSSLPLFRVTRYQQNKRDFPGFPAAVAGHMTQCWPASNRFKSIREGSQESCCLLIWEDRLAGRCLLTVTYPCPFLLHGRRPRCLEEWQLSHNQPGEDGRAEIQKDLRILTHTAVWLSPLYRCENWSLERSCLHKVAT